MEDYKQDIISTRVGCLGGSDAKMIDAIATMGYVPKSAYKRLALCKGLIEHKDISTKEMRFGDFIEQSIYEHCKEVDSRWQSNPCIISEKYSRPNVKCIDHMDLLLIDEENKHITVGEVKATKYNLESTRYEYKAQLCHHYLLAQELANRKGRGWSVTVILCHYDTNGIDLNNEWVFDYDRLTTHQVRCKANMYNIALGMDIVNEFLSSFDAYYEDDEIDAELLPENVKSEFDMVTRALCEIKEREDKVNEFKARLCTFMQEKGIKSIKNDEWSITLVGETESVTFDYKAFLDDYARKYPIKYRRLIKQFEKRSKRKAYVNIKLKSNK